ncbi:hypothetical protein GCM10027347_57020 [Larkinella harenae]
MSSSSETDSFCILLIDDDPAVAEILSRACEQVFPEATLIAVTNFEQAVAYFDKLNGPGPRLVLLDLDLKGGQNGLEFLQLMRRHPQGRFLPIVVLSVSQNTQIMEESYRQGATAYTVKPFSYSDWRVYGDQLRTYWYHMVSVPVINFGQSQPV